MSQEDQDWETGCPTSPDGQHCNCWYDAEACCFCADSAEPTKEEEKSMQILDIKNSPGSPLIAEVDAGEWVSVSRTGAASDNDAGFLLTRSEIASLATNFPEPIKDSFQAAATEVASVCSMFDSTNHIDPVKVSAIETVIRKHLQGGGK